MDVEFELDTVDDQELIAELENRGWFVGEEKGWEPDEELSQEEITFILNKFQMSLPGTIGYEIYEKLRKR
jgi:hypothetical protein